MRCAPLPMPPAACPLAALTVAMAVVAAGAAESVAESVAERIDQGRGPGDAERRGEITSLLGGGRGTAQLEGRNLPDRRFPTDRLKTSDLTTAKGLAGL